MTDVGNLARTQNLNLVSGTTFTWGLTVTENDVAKPWAGVTLSSAILDNSTGTAVATNLTLTTGASGVLTVSLSATDTATLGVGTYRYWIKSTVGATVDDWIGGQIALNRADQGGSSSLTTTLSITTGATTILAITTGTATATSIPIVDTGNYYTTDDVNSALQQVGLQTAIAPIVIVPPGCTVVVPAAAVWFGVNQTLGCKFTVPVRGTYRYVNWLVGVQSGNVQVCVVKFTSGLAYTRVMNSGIIACPGAGAVKTDLGSTVLDAGDYALCFWADNTTLTLGHSNAGTAWTAAEMSVAFSTPAGAIPASGTATYSGRILHAFVLSQT